MPPDDLLRHSRIWTPGQAYQSPTGIGTWVVEALYEGMTVIYAGEGAPLRGAAGVVHFANRDLGIRLIAFADDPQLDKLTRI